MEAKTIVYMIIWQNKEVRICFSFHRKLMEIFTKWIYTCIWVKFIFILKTIAYLLEKFFSQNMNMIYMHMLNKLGKVRHISTALKYLTYWFAE